MLVFCVSVFQLVDGVRQGFGDKTAPVLAEVPGNIRLVVVVHKKSEKGLWPVEA
jgi:hypothetical protein